MKKLFAVTLGILTAIGGFVDVGDLVAAALSGARFGMALAWVLVLGVIGICGYAEMSGRPPLRDQPPLRCHELIGARAYDRSGGYLGRVADLVLTPDGDGRWRLAEIVVTAGPWGRLLGYEREEETGPWPLVPLARWLLRRNTRRLRWTEVVVGHDDPHGA